MYIVFPLVSLFVMFLDILLILYIHAGQLLGHRASRVRQSTVLGYSANITVDVQLCSMGEAVTLCLCACLRSPFRSYF